HYLAKDAAQEAFVAAWIQLKALSSPYKFRAYVCAIAKNYAKKMVMRDHLIPTVSFSDFENREFETGDQNGTGYPVNDDIYDRLLEEVEALRDTVRETVRLYYFEGLPVKGIADRLGVPEGTVKWRLSEGRKQLKKGFGMMDKEMQTVENPALSAHVMERIQELELCKLKNNHKGLQKAYQSALEAVEGLCDEQSRNYLLASIIYDGSPYQMPDMTRWKQAILAGHNDMMMCNFTSWENHHLDGQEKIDFMREVQIPFLKEHGFPLSVGYVYLMMAFEYFWEHRYEEALETVRQAKTLLEPASVYYANAVSAISSWNKMLANPGSVPTFRGEHLKYINGSLYYCESPGIIFKDTRLYDFCLCDNCMIFAGLAPGESRISDSGYVTYTFLDEHAAVETLVGIFENCRVYEVRRENSIRGSQQPFYYCCTTYLCEGIGMVCQDIKTEGNEFYENRQYLLTDYEIRGGTGWFPLYKGNRWSYTDVWNDTHTTKYDAYYEVTSWNGTDAMLAAEEIAYTPKSGEVSS
ncbi:MAG: RNA polymerase sigma factor, partial [Eubacterium sp.]|nr:RNA polymerase sigma factor [Eubacterium sp.]